jgi:hypothetical protein
MGNCLQFLASENIKQPNKEGTNISKRHEQYQEQFKVEDDDISGINEGSVIKKKKKKKKINN